MPLSQEPFFQILRAGSLFLAVLTLYLTIKRSMINGKWWFDVSMIILMLHGILFYGSLFIVSIFKIYYGDYPFLFSDWSALLRFHGYGTLFLIAYANLKREKLK